MPPKTPKPSNGDLFRMLLENIIDQRHELVRLSRLIDWARFDAAFGAFYDDQKGRESLPTRLMAGLHLLKHMKGLSDEQVCAAWLENPYFQSFCGEVYFQHELPFDRSSMTHWRKRIGDKLDIPLAESLRVAHGSGALKKSDLARVTVDTTVQPKNITFPTDAKLLLTAIEQLAKRARQHNIKLRQSYVRVAKRAAMMAGRYAHAKQFKRMNRAIKSLRTRLGRLSRDNDLKAAFLVPLINAIMSAVGYNFRPILKWLRALLSKFIAEILQAIIQIMPIPAIKTAS